MKTSTVAVVASWAVRAAHSMTHPGIINSLSELNNIKSKVAGGVMPWSGAYEALKNDAMGSKTYTASPTATITTSSPGRRDAAAAYLNALNWYITSDDEYIDNAISIINSYVSAVNMVDFDAQITGYFMAFKFSAAIEIIRQSSLWTSAYQSSWHSWVYSVLFEPICYAGITGSVSGITGDGNQGAGDLKCVMAIAVSTDNDTMYDYAVDLYKNNECFGVTGYIDDNGCTGEAGRDMAHPQGALEHLSDCAKTAEIQGDTTLWSCGNNRLLTAWEWMAKRNLNSGSVPFTKSGDCHSAWSSLSDTNLGKLAPSYELPLAYYTSKGLSMPYSAAVVAYHGPELGSSAGGTGEDTLYASLVYSETANTTTPIVASGTYNIRPSAQSSLYVGAATTGGKLTLATTATETWSFTHLGNDVYRISPTSNISYAWDAGSSSGATGSIPYSNGACGPYGAPVNSWQIWKLLPGDDDSVSFVTVLSVTSEIPRTYLFLSTQGVSGTQLIMEAGTEDTTTTDSAQQFLLEAT